MELVNSFKKYLMSVVPDIVYKSVKQAEVNETKDSRFNGDSYVDAVLKTDSFYTYPSGSISVNILNQIGIYDSSLINAINNDKFLIPKRLWDTVVELHRKEVISNYEEQNNYYRMLNGLPNMGEPPIYLNPMELESFGYTNDNMDDYENNRLDKLTPIHKLPRNVLLIMESSGYLKEVYDGYEKDTDINAEYVKYLGLKKIDIVTARTSTQYELMYVATVSNANRFIRDFTNYYEEARQYFLNQIYNYHFSSEYDFYEGYIGFFILVMAIERTINSMFEVVVERDFYDIETCRMFLEAYNVPFVQNFTFAKQLTLVKNLNILLMEKCTTNVLYDILSLLEYDKYSLTKYILVKQHKTETYSVINDEQVPIFIYKTYISSDGTPKYELDKSKMYDYYFVGVDVKENEIELVESDTPKAFSYKDIIEGDVYWIEDNDLITKLQEDEINYVETKYLNVSVTLRMYEMMFEHIYLQKMICDKGLETSKIIVDIPLITNYNVSLLDLEVLLICLLCKYHGMSPDLLKTPSKQLSVLGFNFDADLEAIKEEVLNNPSIYSKELAKYMENITFNSVNDVNEMFNNVKQLSTLLITGMSETRSERVYHAYRKLYQTLMITDVHNEIFALPDGSIPDSYMDWLKENNYALYDFVTNLSRSEILDKINYITTKMISWFTYTKYLNHLNPIDLNVVNDLVKILKWFKSYTIDIKSLDIIFLFDSRYYNSMKLLDRIWLHANSTLRETSISYRDFINSISGNENIREVKNKLYEALRTSGNISTRDIDKLLIRSKVKPISKTIRPKDDINSKHDDDLTCIANMNINETELTHHDDFSSSFHMYAKERYNAILNDNIKSIDSSITIKDLSLSNYTDLLLSSICNLQLEDKKTVMHDGIKIIRD